MMSPAFTGLFYSVLMLRHVLELVLRPGGNGMNRSAFIAHYVEFAGRDCDRLCAEAKEAADIDDNSPGITDAVHMRDGADLFVVGAIDGRTLEVAVGYFDVRKPDVSAVVQFWHPLVFARRQH
ncbi:conserved hypothetical protein [Rhizobium sp. EC-SD404]|nr:conserved hypothetical protein [Rhizobium sp. EC-SD404]